MMFADKTQCAFYFKLIQQIWADKDILLIEGEKSRLGVGNDLFDNVKSIRRILAPNTNAFDHYDAIMKIVQKYSPNEYLILLALGLLPQSWLTTLPKKDTKPLTSVISTSNTSGTEWERATKCPFQANMSMKPMQV